MFLTARSCRRVSITTNTVSCLRLFIATCHCADRLWYQDLDGDHAPHHTGLNQSPHSPLEDHRKLRLEGTFESHLVQPPAQAGTPRTGWPGPCPGTSKEGDGTTSLGQPVPVLSHAHSTEVLSVFKGNLLCVSAASCPGTGHGLKQPGCSHFAPSFNVICTLWWEPRYSPHLCFADDF